MPVGYISGALTTVDDGARTRVFYELLAEIAADCGLDPYLPHHATDPVADPGLDPQSVYDSGRAQVSRSAVVIAYAGTPSFGVGIEVEMARERGIPVILVAERDRVVSRILLGSPAVVEVVRFSDLAALRRSLGDAIGRVIRETTAKLATDAVVQRFLGSLGAARHLPDAEVAALLRVAELDGDPAAAIRAAVSDGRLFGAGLRDLIGRHALRGPELAAFVLRDILERPLHEAARVLGCDARTVRRRTGAARERLHLAGDAEGAVIGQWLVTELIAPPTRALQLRLFAGAAQKVENDEQGTTQAEDHRQAGLAVEEGEPRA